MASPAAPGLFLCFAALVLLVFVSVSTPTWDEVSFLDVTNGRTTIKFGVLGFTGSSTSVGYTIDPTLLGLPANSLKLNNETIRKLTSVLILHPIAAGLSALAVLFGLCGAAYSRAGTIFMTLAATLAALVTLAAFAIDMILWTIVRNRIRDLGASVRVTARYGVANWLTLGAAVALILAFCAGSLGSCGRYRKQRATI
ncbi:pali-domain-containing protein [Hysterangium stoloniferum]|nr:pali-domain-containing protein [Hysterangium stoloniferum]